MKSEMLKLSIRLKQVIQDYCLSIDSINDEYYNSINILLELEEKAFRNEPVLKSYLSYLKFGSTIKLKALLADNTKFNEDNILDFNSFCLIDSCHLQMQRLFSS